MAQYVAEYSGIIYYNDLKEAMVRPTYNIYYYQIVGDYIDNGPETTAPGHPLNQLLELFVQSRVIGSRIQHVNNNPSLI